MQPHELVSLSGAVAAGQTHLNCYMRGGCCELRWGDGQSPEVFC
jgi:hypothetical protein